MDHQICNDVDIRRAVYKLTQSMDFNKSWSIQFGGESDHTRIETLEMTYLQERAGLARQVDDRLGIAKGVRYGFFQEHRDTFFQKRFCNLAVHGGRHHDTDRIHAIQHLLDITNKRATTLTGNALTCLDICIHHPAQGDIRHPLIDLGMDRTEIPHAYDTDF